MIRKGILKAFDSNTYKASVQVIGSLSVWLDNVAVSAAINSADLVVGRSVVLLSLDPGNPDDCILVGLWGVPQEPPAPGAHENTHTDGACDEIDSALDPRAYPMLAGTLAARPAAGVEGRFYWTTDEHILYRDNGTSWVKVAVADHTDLDGTGANDHHNQVHDLAGEDHSADSYANLNSKVSDATLEKQENRGQASGYCDLDASALVPLARIPATLTGKDADTVDGDHKTDLESTMDSKISTHAAVAGAHHPAIHGLGGGYHTGATFAELNSKVSDATLLKQGDTLTGNLGANPGVSVDGVDISAHAADASAHHAKTGDNEVCGLILCDIVANRPAAGTANRFFWATDEHILYRDTGSAWVKAAVADHADLDGIGASDHHAKYTDAEAKAACVSDTPYDGTGWNGVTDVAPSKNAVRDELEGHYAAADPHSGYVLESLFDAKGDIIVATADNMPTRLAVGTDGQVLTADSTQASGTKWATSSAGADNNARILAFMGV